MNIGHLKQKGEVKKVDVNKFIDEDNPLIGSWVTNDDDSSAMFSISVENNRFLVEGIDRMDGEAFQISDIHWDGKKLSFTSKMKSMNYTVRHVMFSISKNRIIHEYTIPEKWKRIKLR
jgi:hypothetical protein